MTTANQPHAPKPHYAIEGSTEQADTGWVKRKYLDVPYASLSPAQRLDIYLPEDAPAPYPVIVAIHGGAFMGCDKGDMQVLPMLEGLKRGYAVVSINYRMSGEAKFPALVQDAKAAARWLRGNASQYQFDPQKVFSWGGSAGGYLSSMLAISAGVPELEDLSLGYAYQPSNVQAAVVLYGPTDFLKMDAQLEASGLLAPPGFRHSEPNSPESLLLGDVITAIPERVAAANPETYIGGTIPPMLFQHGRIDPVVPVQQSIEFVEKLQRKFGMERVTLEILENAGHGGDPAFDTAENIERIFRFLQPFSGRF